MIHLPGESYTFTGIPDFVTVGRYSSIAKNVIFHSLEREHQWSVNHKCVYTMHWDQPNETGKITIGNDVWIGESVRILPNTTIGDGCIVGAGAVIKGDYPDFSVIVGNPGIVKYRRFSIWQMNELKKIKWWDWPKDKVLENKELMKDIDKFLKKYE